MLAQHWLCALLPGILFLSLDDTNHAGPRHCSYTAAQAQPVQQSSRSSRPFPPLALASTRTRLHARCTVDGARAPSSLNSDEHKLQQTLAIRLAEPVVLDGDGTSCFPAFLRPNLRVQEKKTACILVFMAARSEWSRQLQTHTRIDTRFTMGHTAQTYYTKHTMNDIAVIVERAGAQGEEEKTWRRIRPPDTLEPMKQDKSCKLQRRRHRTSSPESHAYAKKKNRYRTLLLRHHECRQPSSSRFSYAFLCDPDDVSALAMKVLR